MKCVQRTGYIATVIIPIFFVACGGDSSSNNNNLLTKPPSINLSITQTQVKAYAGENKTIPVMASNTDFTVSVNLLGSGCVKSGSNIVCTPETPGTYIITVTATADSTKTVSATMTVPDLEILSGNEQTLYADDDELTIVFYSFGNWTATATDSYGDTPAWLSIYAVGSVFADNSTQELYEGDTWLQQYGSREDNSVDVSVYAANASGQAGNNAITMALQPNVNRAGFSGDSIM